MATWDTQYADSPGKGCGACDAVGEIYCRASSHQAVRVPARFSVRKEGH
ncbi:hypothetical protein VSR01_27320 [Actinacidiphila sp. DG2A-62]|nr:hypothetical protein [Actinacidiphila sp. DG2A-62]MEC3997018.1 hypothetical protein [Actinacidiphila sp. DG2A-62]